MDPNRPTAIYLLLDEDGVPRYVGKSVDPMDRLRGHQKERPWLAAMIVLEWTTQSKYRERERGWIKVFRKMGFPLDNGNDGGGGLVELPVEYRENLRRKNTGKKQSPESSEKKRAAMLARKAAGLTASEETREKLRIANTGKKQSEETKEKIRQNSLKQWENQRAEGYKPSEEHKSNISLAVKAKYENPEHKTKHKEACGARGPLSDGHKESLKAAWGRNHKSRVEKCRATRSANLAKKKGDTNVTCQHDSN